MTSAARLRLAERALAEAQSAAHAERSAAAEPTGAEAGRVAALRRRGEYVEPLLSAVPLSPAATARIAEAEAAVEALRDEQRAELEQRWTTHGAAAGVAEARKRHPVTDRPAAVVDSADDAEPDVRTSTVADGRAEAARRAALRPQRKPADEDDL